jgi:NADH-quinone oxidoreductase subunit E
MAHTSTVEQADLDRLQAYLLAHFQPHDHEEAQELILGALQHVQHEFGWVPIEASKLIAEHLGVSVNRIYGLLTFYADFRTEPPGEHFMLLCHGAACFVGGSQKLIHVLRDSYGVGQGGTTADGKLTVQIVNGCLGVCDLAPIVQFDHEKYVGKLDVDSFNAAIKEITSGGPNQVDHGAD